LAKAYKIAKEQGRLSPSPLRSLLEQDQKPLVGLGNELARGTKITLGIESPRRLTPIEHDYRIEELRAQAAQLIAASGQLAATAGLSEALLFARGAA
jgi:hypothetical protein